MRRSKEEKDRDILWEMYRKAFSASTPTANFDELVENAVIDEKGMKHIPFMDYECDESVLNEIVDETMKKYKVPKWKRRSFSVSFYLGCSPKTKFNIN